MPYLTSIGVSRSAAGTIATALPLTSIAGRLFLAWQADKHERRKVVILSLVLVLVGLALFRLLPIIGVGLWVLVPFCIFYSSGYGAVNAIRPSLVREYFGRNNFGTVFGLMTGIGMIGGIAGAPLAGWAYDHWGSYQNVWTAFLILPVISIVSLVTLSKPTLNAQSTDGK